MNLIPKHAFKSRLASFLFIGLLSISTVVTANDFEAGDFKDIAWQEYTDARSLNSDKPIFVFAELHFCSACKKMKAEVFNQADIIKVLNERFIPVNMKSLGIFPNQLEDLKDTEGETLSLMGSPALVVVYKDQYKVIYGFHNAAQLSQILKQSLSQIAQANS